MKYVRVYYDWFEDEVESVVTTNTAIEPHLCQEKMLFCVTLAPSDNFLEKARELWRENKEELLRL